MVSSATWSTVSQSRFWMRWHRIASNELETTTNCLHMYIAAKTPAKQRSLKISSIVDNLCSAAHESGLSSTSLSRLVDAVTQPNELDQASLRSLIRHLYPRAKVPDIIVIKVVGCLGHGKGKPKYTTQAALLDWLVL